MKSKTILILILFFLKFNISQQSLSAGDYFQCDFDIKYEIGIDHTADSGEASIREHSIVWHPIKKKYYLLADAIPLSNPHHPLTYLSEIHLWSSFDLSDWKHHGVAVKRGKTEIDFDRYGVASPAGTAFYQGEIYVPYSARRTEKFQKRAIGLAWSGENPEEVPWEKSPKPISDLVGEDDDPALLTLENQKEIHLYHRIAGPEGYQIVHSQSGQPQNSKTWSRAIPAVVRPKTVRAQELTGVVLIDKTIHMFVIEHLYKKGVKIAHLASRKTEGPFVPLEGQSRYLSNSSQPRSIVYSGHITPVSKNGKLKAFFWTARQSGKRYGLLGHPASVKKLPGS